MMQRFQWQTFARPTLRKAAVSLGAGLWLCACQVASEKPLEKPVVPAWREAGSAIRTAPVATDSASSGIRTPATVWQGAGNAELRHWLETGKSLNSDIQMALQRVAQARAVRAAADAGGFPQVDAGVQVSRSRGEGDAAMGGSQQAGVGLTYEVDVWQRVANAAEASRYRESASQWDLIALEQSIAAAIAEDYAAVLALRERIRIAGANRALLKEVQAIVEARIDAGAATALEGSQQRVEVARAEAALQTLKLQEKNRLHSLAVLTGQMPQTMSVQSASLADVSLPALMTLPAEALLERRPDILAVEESLAAARLDIAVARAALYPSMEIGADVALVKNPYNAPAEWLGSLFGALSARLFDGGALRAEVALAQARHGELLAQYRGVVIQACREAEDAMASLLVARARLRHLADARQAALQAYQLARERYSAGAIDFLTLLETQRSLLLAEDEQVQAQLAEFAAGVQWIRAFAGA